MNSQQNVGASPKALAAADRCAMSALRKKIAEKKRAEAAAAPAAAPAEAPQAAPSRRTTPVPEGAIQKGWLTRGELYPEGSQEASLTSEWRGTATSMVRSTAFELVTLPTTYEVRGKFQEAGQFLGKEDFEVTRNGLNLRIRGNPNNDVQSLVKGLDETILLPADAGFDGTSAEFAHCELCVTIPRLREIQDLLEQMTVEERKELAARLAAAPSPASVPMQPSDAGTACTPPSSSDDAVQAPLPDSDAPPVEEDEVPLVEVD